MAGTSIILSPAELEDVKRRVAADIKATILGGIDVADLQLMDIATVSAFTGLPVDRVAKAMEVIELGPRSRRVRISVYQAYLARNAKQPA